MSAMPADALPMYVDRMRAGSISTRSSAVVVHDGGTAVVLDAHNERVHRLSERIRNSKKAAGTQRIYAPGDLERAWRGASGARCSIAPEVMAKLNECGSKLGLKGIA
jgi:LDH2 family malate/lactate/ureidoglycolate dehydrogenase